MAQNGLYNMAIFTSFKNFLKICHRATELVVIRSQIRAQIMTNLETRGYFGEVRLVRKISCLIGVVQ
jgi:hypothetical protein